MCGIAGIISINPQLVQQNKLQLMATALQHRGPDGEGYWINENGTVGLAHRRLSVIDLSDAAAQPLFYPSPLERVGVRYTITFNGEIYNYLELKEELQKRGYTFTTTSDTEVIPAAYDCWGKDCLQYFDGMFSFALWDEQEQTLFCARDRFGEKPFYYLPPTPSNGGRAEAPTFYFASEMKALWAIGIEKQTNNTALLNYLTLGFVSNPTNAFETFYQGIQKLPAAHWLQINFATDALQITTAQYWDIDKETIAPISVHDAQEKLLELLFKSVQRRLRSDVAVGTSLSGGLDSSSIVASLQLPPKEGEQQFGLQTFSAVFPGFKNDESAFIQQVTHQFSLENFTTTPTANGLIDDFEKLLYHQEEPFASASIYAQYKVYELAKQHGVTVLLDGQGADETLGGYHKYYHWYWQELVAKGKFGLLQKERSAAKNIGVNQSWSFKNYAAVYLPAMAATRLEKNLSRQQKQNKNIAADFLHAHHNANNFHKPIVTKLNDILYYNTMQLGLEELLRYADRNSMAFGREVRLPFLSHQLVQFIFSLPASYKISNGFTKNILRLAMNNYLPKQIVWRKDKVGFEPPQQQWLQHKPMQDYIHEAKQTLVQNGILSKEVLQNAVQAKPAHEADNFDWRYLCAASCLR
jgi:asparagine synthase (glutamine-hydrolysing)